MSTIEKSTARPAQSKTQPKAKQRRAQTESRARNADAKKSPSTSDRSTGAAKSNATKSAQANPKAQATEAEANKKQNANQAHGLLFMSPVSSIASTLGSVTSGNAPAIQQGMDGLRSYFMDGGKSEISQDKSVIQNETAAGENRAVLEPEGSAEALKKFPRHLKGDERVIFDGAQTTASDIAKLMSTGQISPLSFSVVELEDGRKMYPAQFRALQLPWFKVTSPSGSPASVEQDMRLGRLGMAEGWPGKYKVTDSEGNSEVIPASELMQNYQFVSGDLVSRRVSDFNEFTPVNGAMVTNRPANGPSIVGASQNPSNFASNNRGEAHVTKEVSRLNQRFLFFQNGRIVATVNNPAEAKEFYATHHLMVDNGELKITPNWPQMLHHRGLLSSEEQSAPPLPVSGELV
jgi:hypothetical protein